VKLTDLTRLEICLPVNEKTLKDLRAFVSLFATYCEGATCSMQTLPSPFIGYWYDKAKKTLFPPEYVVVMTAGVEVVEKETKFFDDLEALKELIVEMGEIETWITIAPMTRYE